MQEQQAQSSRNARLWIRLATFPLVWVFCLPGAAVLVEIVRYARVPKLPSPAEATIIGLAAIALAVCLMTNRILARGLGWAIVLLGHAALVNALVPDRPANVQLIWLGAATAFGILVGVLACSPRLNGRILLVGVLVVAAVTVFALRYETRAATQTRIARAVAHWNGHTIYDHPGTPPLLFRWLDAMAGDEQLCLRSIELGPNAGDHELNELAAMGLGELPHLRELRLRQSRVTDEGLVIVEPLAELERLTLGRATTDAGLEELDGLPALRVLDLTNTHVTGEGLRCACHFPALVVLNLQDTQITDNDLASLKAFPQLTNLDLSATPITDTGLVYLKDLPNLSSLFLLRTPVTDAGLKQLEQVPQLQWLFLKGSKVTWAGLQEFHRARPGVWTD